MSPRQVLVLGNPRGAGNTAIETALSDIDAHPVFATRADDGITQLAQGDWTALLAAMTTPGAARFCQAARAERRLFNVPLIALSPGLTDLAFANAFRWGCDDLVVEGNSSALVTRLAPVKSHVAVRPRPTRGEAVIADAERSRCDVLGRVLTGAGYSVKYATDLTAARFYSTKASVGLFVVNSELHNPLALLRESRRAGSKADWIVMAKTRELDALEKELVPFDRALAMASHGPPENVLFAINVLSPSSDELKRSYVRALHGAIALFRRAGEDRDECGFTFSVSAQGAYIRTLVPPPEGAVWLELNPPGASRRLRLSGRVAWSRTFGEAGADIAPPGFGLEIVQGLDDDLRRWTECFDALPAPAPCSRPTVEPRSVREPFRVPVPHTGSIIPDARTRPSLGPLGRRSSAAQRLAELSGEHRLHTKPSTIPVTQHAAVRGSKGESAAASLRGDSITLHPPEPNDGPTPAGTLDTAGPDTPPPEPAVLPLPPGVEPHNTREVDLDDADLQSIPPGTSARSSGPRKATEPVAAVDTLARTQFPSEEAPEAPEARRRPLSDPPESQTDPAIPGALAAAHLAARDKTGRGQEQEFRGQTTQPEGGRTQLGLGAVSVGRTPALHHVAAGSAGDNAGAAPAQVQPQSPAPQTPGGEVTNEPGDPVTEAPVDTRRGLGEPSEAPPPREPKSPAARDDDDTQETPFAAHGDWDDAPGANTNTTASLDAPPKNRTTSIWLWAALAAGAGALLIGVPKYLGRPPPAATVSTVPNPSATPDEEAQPRGAPAQVSEAKASTIRPEPPADLGAVTPNGHDESPHGTPQPGDTAAQASAPNAGASQEAREGVELRPPSAPGASVVANKAPTVAPAPIDVPPSEPLADGQGWLFVRSAISSNVFVHGRNAGRTNRWLKVHCGPRYIRLGKTPGDWDSPGLPSKLKCRAATVLTLQP